jgi:hypothetical protein
MFAVVTHWRTIKFLFTNASTICPCCLSWLEHLASSMGTRWSSSLPGTVPQSYSSTNSSSTLAVTSSTWSHHDATDALIFSLSYDWILIAPMKECLVCACDMSEKSVTQMRHLVVAVC